jgi:hypothetical protein
MGMKLVQGTMVWWVGLILGIERRGNCRAFVCALAQYLEGGGKLFLFRARITLGGF